MSNKKNFKKNQAATFLKSRGLWVILISLAAGLYVFMNVQPQWLEQKTIYEVSLNQHDQLSYSQNGKTTLIEQAIPYSDSKLNQLSLDASNSNPSIRKQWVVEQITVDGKPVTQHSLLEAKFHYGWWSLLPALVAISLCLLTKDPLTSLAGGIVVGAFMLGKFDLTGEVLIPSLASPGSASILILYLWLLGGLLGIWSKTGAAKAFADFMAKNFIQGPKSAKFVAWLLGIVFFQGGTVSTVLVGTTVRPLADKENISHEEMSYIVDSTASPIAALLAFNAWPAYVQALIFVPGVTFLATEADRISFFFSSVSYSFYAILAVLGTLLLSLDITVFSGKSMRQAVTRSRESGQLDAPGAKPLSSKELQTTDVPTHYQPHVIE
ncbi:MAG: hypothetical protein JKX81_15680, partial [Arenicella sp.]|nr:hypothetical protein [Arenicella sp.]